MGQQHLFQRTTRDVHPQHSDALAHQWLDSGHLEPHHVAGKLGSVSLTSSMLGGACMYRLTGSMNVVIEEDTQRLRINEQVGQLNISGTTAGCFGIYANGNTVDLAGDFTLSTSAPLGLA